MNRRQKKKRTLKYTIGTAKIRRRNKRLCERYPFLIPRNDFTDKISFFDKRYSYTLADDFPKGWWKSFGIMLCEELREDLIKHNFLYEYRIVQIKEKFGELRIYDNGVPTGSKAWDIIRKYTHLSSNICISCGKPDVPMIGRGWFMPECFECYKKNESYFYKKKEAEPDWATEYLKGTSPEDNGKMPNEVMYSRYENGEWVKYVEDISETAEKIRNNWSMRR